METVNKSYIAVIGIYDANTTEIIVLKETGVQAKDQYEAHKLALFKCNLQEKQDVLRIIELTSRNIRFDFQKGFTG
jgi:hypothetical protein